MKIGISMWSFVGILNAKSISIRDLLKAYRQHGVQYVELLDYFLENKDEFNAVKEWLEEFSLSVSSYSIGNDFINCDDLGKEIARVKQGIDHAHLFGAPIVRVFSGNMKESMDFEQSFTQIVKCFQQCINYAEEKNVVLALENHGKLAGRSEQILRIIDAVGSEYLKITADTGNFLLMGENPLCAVNAVMSHIRLVHFKDMVKTEGGKYSNTEGKSYDGTILGQGSVPLAEIVEDLKKYGYTGNISIEYEGSGKDIDEVWQSYRYLQSLL